MSKCFVCLSVLFNSLKRCVDYFSDAEQSGEPTKVFVMDATNGGDAATLYTLFELVYDGCMSDQDDIKANRLPQLMACADYLQVTGVTEACKVLLNELSARNDVRCVLCCLSSCLIIISINMLKSCRTNLINCCSGTKQQQFILATLSFWCQFASC